jgi:hypothetical protein
MSSHLRHIWLNEPIKSSPAVKLIYLAYEKIERILLSFTIDLSRSTNSYLDPSRPIKINGTIVQIPELQRDSYSLNFVERKELDVTKLLKHSPTGEDNTIEVYFKSSQKFWSKKEVGKLNLVFTIYFPKEEAPKQQKQESMSIKFMFCIFCRREIPDYSKFCCHCGAKQEGGGREVKTCTVDNESLPQNARFCRKCGTAQPQSDKAQPQPQPGKAQPQPGKDQPQPGKDQPQPGKDQPQPGKDQPQPGKDQPQPKS